MPDTEREGVIFQPNQSKLPQAPMEAKSITRLKKGSNTVVQIESL